MALRFPFELSAGQIQRFSLIRTFMLNPEFVLLDEPTSSLIPSTRHRYLTFRDAAGSRAGSLDHCPLATDSAESV